MGMNERDCCQQISYESRERSFAAVSNSIAVISLDLTDIDPIYLRQVKMKLYFSLCEIEKNIFQVWEYFLPNQDDKNHKGTGGTKLGSARFFGNSAQARLVSYWLVR